MLKLNLGNYGDAHMLVKGTITVINMGAKPENVNDTAEK